MKIHVCGLTIELGPEDPEGITTKYLGGAITEGSMTDEEDSPEEQAAFSTVERLILTHCPQVLSAATPSGTSFQGSCACCGWTAEVLRDEPTRALSDAYDHLAQCEELWAA